MSKLLTKRAVLFLIIFIVPVLLLSIIVLAVVIIDKGGNSKEKDVSSFKNRMDLVEALNASDYYPAEPRFLDDVSFLRDEVTSLESAPSGGLDDFSSTNVQVEGVDEADIIKTDGEYIYLIAGERLYIVDSENMDVKSEAKLKGSPREMFLTGDRIVVYSTNINIPSFRESSYWGIDSQVGIFIYDISDKSSIDAVREITIDGNYKTARMTGGVVYLVAFHDFYKKEDVTLENLDEVLPKYNDSYEKSGEEKVLAESEDIYKVGEKGKRFVNIVAVDVDGDSLTTKVLFGDLGTIYMSLNNLYIAATEYEYDEYDYMVEDERACNFLSDAMGFCDTNPIAPEVDPFRVTEPPSTGIYRFSVSGLDLNFEAYGNVPGTVLNQFSMDEYNQNLRIATTKTDVGSWEGDTQNNIYVLEIDDLSIAGELTDLAPDEQIYSVRYIGNRAYMVTFKAIDPFFVIDLSDPKSPSVLGELKIPGFSDYLHPYDDNHIIGVGKGAESISEDWALQQGVKIALFDVSNVNEPVEVDKVVIGDRGTESAILEDHKAFLFDRDKDILVIPVDISEVEYDIEDTLQGRFGTEESTDYRVESGVVFVYSETKDESIESFLNSQETLEGLNIKESQNIINGKEYSYIYSTNIKDHDFYAYGNREFEGFAVFGIDAEKGFSEKGRLGEESRDSNVWIGYYAQYPRSLYIGDHLYTFRNSKLKKYKLDGLDFVDELKMDIDNDFDTSTDAGVDGVILER